MEVWLNHQLRRFWWWVCGLTPATYRAVCGHCGATGQVHLVGGGCRRVRPRVTGQERTP